MDANPVELVRSGYNALSLHYRGDDDPARGYEPWLADLRERIPSGSRVLDVGCGCGVPVARQLAAAGYHVTGVDVSDVQIERARWLRPGGWFLAVAGQDAWTGTEDNWLGGPAAMWWSQADAATYRTWLAQAGLEVTSQQFVPEGDGGHALFWARLKPADLADRLPEPGRQGP